MDKDIRDYLMYCLKSMNYNCFSERIAGDLKRVEYLIRNEAKLCFEENKDVHIAVSWIALDESMKKILVPILLERTAVFDVHVGMTAHPATAVMNSTIGIVGFKAFFEIAEGNPLPFAAFFKNIGYDGKEPEHSHLEFCYLISAGTLENSRAKFFVEGRQEPLKIVEVKLEKAVELLPSDYGIALKQYLGV